MRLVRSPPSPPPLWKVDQTTPKAPPLVWCEHCQDMTRWCPLYGANTLDESWKVFDEERRQQDLIGRREYEKKRKQEWLKRQEIEKMMKETQKKKEVEAKRKKEEEAMEREEKRRKELHGGMEWLTKQNIEWSLWKGPAP